ncbi:hypothetical protein [Haloplanus sp. C73]|uniref:hypothetical protein n=1 Tax=Haloplanus sp. C73 TaxID=3421641 RepID=UPI003EBEF2C8
MSNSNPFSSAFEMQRTMIDQSRRAAETTLDAQRAAVETWSDSLESAKSLQESGVALSKTAINAYLDGLGAVFPEESITELEAAVDEQFEAGEEIHEEAWLSFLESADEAEAVFDDLTETQSELLEESFDAIEQIQTDAAESAEEAVESAEELAESA